LFAFGHVLETNITAMAMVTSKQAGSIAKFTKTGVKRSALFQKTPKV
jgi:hypothetical protein